MSKQRYYVDVTTCGDIVIRDYGETIQKFYDMSVAQRTCDELNAMDLLRQKKIELEAIGGM